MRETYEEAGIRVRPESLKLVHITQPDIGTWPYVDIIFYSDDFDGDAVTNEVEKVSALVWFKPEDFPEKLTLSAHAFKQVGFPTNDLSYSYVDEDRYEEIIGERYVG